ncbi:MAG: ribosome small subunit-dependent GTPase A [Betaproteobacteria bacterium]
MSAGAGPGFEARVVAAYGRHWLVRDAAGTLWQAVRRGKRGDVVVGDRVRCAVTARDAVIDSVLPRASLFYRTAEHRTKELAANVDLVVLVYAPRPAFNLYFLWRALVAARAADVAVLAVLNKTDLPDADGEARATLDQLAALGTPTLALSAKHDAAQAAAVLLATIAGRVGLLVGQSGMGKSTILNLVAPDAHARTQEYSARLNLGKQTTTAARWFDLPGGGSLIDTPGFQEFGLAHLSRAEVAAALPEFETCLGQCRFSDCRHLEEPGCAVRAAVAAGAIDPRRYAFYRDLAAA